MTIAIARARREDGPRLAELWWEMMRDISRQDDRVVLSAQGAEHYRFYLECYIARADADVLVARDGADGPIVGYCLAHLARGLPMFEPGRYGYLSDIVVRPRWRRQGIGHALVEQVEAAMKARGVVCMQLNVYDCNATGVEFWRTMGYAPLTQGRFKALK